VKTKLAADVGTWLSAEKPENRISFPGGSQNFFLQYRVMISSAAHPASASVLKRGIFPEVNQSEIEIDVAKYLHT
jgi:hypothetical protein